MTTLRKLAAVALCAATFTPAETAKANGFELLPGGTQAVARGGAVHARPSDPMVLLHNPAGLTKLSGDQIMLDIDVPFHDMCVKPYGYYGWGVYGEGRSEFGDPLELDDPDDPTIGATYATTPLRQVCNSAPTTGVPQLAWTHRINPDFAIGAGFVIPTGIGGAQFGGEDGTIQTEYGPRPTPTRYALVKQEVLFGLNPTFGAAYRIIPQLSVGASLQVLLVRARSVVVQNSVSGTQPATDWLLDVETEDFFVPALTFSVNSNPIDTVDLMAAFRFIDDVRGSGKVTVETNTFHQQATTGPIPFENDAVNLKNVTVKLPWTVTAGARYAAPLPDAYGADSTGLGDPMDTELWDAELDVSYALNARAGEASVSAGEDVVLSTRTAEGGGEDVVVSLDDLARVDIDRKLSNYFIVRAGGSYAVMPREAMLQAGVFYEGRGVELEHADVDAFFFRRIGFGVGAVLRFGNFDVRAAYGHIRSETVELAPPPHENLEDAVPGDPQSGFDKRVGGTFEDDGTRAGGVVLEDPDAPAPSDANGVAARTQQSAISTTARPERVINAGQYAASFNVVSVGVVYHF